MLSVNGTDLYCERRGAGEPLLLIQGMAGHSLHWGEPFLGLLERDFERHLFFWEQPERAAELVREHVAAARA
jgi:hypothetical protein